MRAIGQAVSTIALVALATTVAAGDIDWQHRDGFWEARADGMVVWRVGSHEDSPGPPSSETAEADTLEQIAGWECPGDIISGGQLHVFDLNANGRPDLAYGNRRYNTFVREGTADNSFQLVHQVSNPVGSYYTRLICAGDGDADKRAELVFGSGTAGIPRDLFIMESKDVGMYPDTVTAVIPEISIPVTHMRMADLDGDGLREYVGTTQSGGTDALVAIWENRGDNSYEQVFSDHPGAANSITGEPSVGDFDGDGAGDLVVVETGPHASVVHVYESKGDDIYQDVWSVEVEADNMYWSTPGPDLDRDRRGDFVVVAASGFVQAGWGFVLFESTGDDAYAPVWTHAVSGGPGYGGAATGDLDGDGWNELVCQTGGRTEVLRFAGNDSLEVVWELAGPVIGQGEHRVIAPDLDFDRKGELIWWTQDDPGQAVVYERVGPTIGVPWPDDNGAGVGRLPLLRSVPNPFVQEAVIRYEIPRSAEWRAALLTIVDPGGRRIRTLMTGPQPAGEHWVAWNGRDEAGRNVPEGVYFVRLQAGGISRAERITRLW